MKHSHLVLLLTLLLCMGVLAPLMLLVSLRQRQESSASVVSVEVVESAMTPLTVGVILTGDAADFGWYDVPADAEFATTTLNGNTVIVLDRLNATYRPGLTLNWAVKGMLERGATTVFVSSAYLSEADEVRVNEQYPNTVFIMNLSTRANVEQVLSVLPDTVSDLHSSTLDDSASAANPVATPTITETTGLDPDGPAVVLPSILLVVILLGIGLVAVVRLNGLDAMRMKAGGKRKLHTPGSTYHARGLALEDAARGRMTDFAAQDGKLLVLHELSTYVLGDRHFDESFPIGLASGEFLGECGLGISEQANRYDRDRITAFELWLFDKRAISTTTAVLASEYATQHAATRAKLSEKGEVVQADLDRVITLETDTLHLEARILALDYGFADTLPANSFFDHLVVEIAVMVR